MQHSTRCNTTFICDWIGYETYSSPPNPSHSLWWAVLLSQLYNRFAAWITQQSSRSRRSIDLEEDNISSCHISCTVLSRAIVIITSLVMTAFTQSIFVGIESGDDDEKTKTTFFHTPISWPSKSKGSLYLPDHIAIELNNQTTKQTNT